MDENKRFEDIERRLARLENAMELIVDMLGSPAWRYTTWRELELRRGTCGEALKRLFEKRS